jgi:GMP synthase (glutamine-hydrolysing)
MEEKILIIDFGSQVTQLIARRVREIGVFSEIRNFDISDEELLEINPKAIILSGGPSSVNCDFAPKVTHKIFSLKVPILGICYGEQLICSEFGASVTKSAKREFGKSFITISKNSELFKDIAQEGDEVQVWMSHGDAVSSLPEGFVAIATTPDAPFAAIENSARKIYAVQFHPEVAHTPCGTKLLENFIRNIAGCKAQWNMDDYKEIAIAKIKEQVGDKKVICALSGGVDSTVTAMLLNQAIGKNLTCVFVNNGLLRKDEAAQVKQLFSENFDVNFIYVDAAETFLSRLKNIDDPEKKRKIIGNLFIEIFEEEAKKIDGVEFLAQGTLYPDVIESLHPTGGASSTIKSHHNVGGLPETMNLKLVEPLRELFKDEVRKLGIALGATEGAVYRHPFPGPGLAIRVLGAVDSEKVKILQEADAIYIEEIKKHGLYREIWQAFVVLLPVKTVGVMGDSRTYEYVAAMRAVTSSDGMTADFYQFSHEFLGKVSSRIVNEVEGINRVTYDVTSKPPATIEWE